GICPERGQGPALGVLVVEATAGPELRELELSVAEHLAGAADRVVLRVVEAFVEGGVDAKLAGEGLGRKRPLGRAVVSRHPGEVGERERLRLQGRRGGRRRGRRGCRRGLAQRLVVRRGPASRGRDEQYSEPEKRAKSFHDDGPPRRKVADRTSRTLQ